MGINDELEKNMKAFYTALPKLLEENRGKYALGRAEEEFSCWESYEDAITIGYDRYGLNQFIVKRILEPELDTERIFNIAA